MPNWRALILIKYIVNYCNNTIKENGPIINSTETSLKQNLKKVEYRNIEEVILQNEESKRRTLKQKIQEIELPETKACQ